MLLITIVMSIQDHFAGLLCEALPSSSPLVAAVNMRLLCEFAHMVYDTAAQSSTTEADVRFPSLSLCLWVKVCAASPKAHVGRRLSVCELAYD